MTSSKVRNWTDQPTNLEEGEHLAGLWVADARRAQVIKCEGLFYVSVGNLFSSQTIRVPDAEEALKVIDWIDRCGSKERQEERSPKARDVKKEHPTWEFFIDGEWQ